MHKRSLVVTTCVVAFMVSALIPGVAAARSCSHPTSSGFLAADCRRGGVEPQLLPANAKGVVFVTSTSEGEVNSSDFEVLLEEKKVKATVASFVPTSTRESPLLAVEMQGRKFWRIGVDGGFILTLQNPGKLCSFLLRRGFLCARWSNLERRDLVPHEPLCAEISSRIRACPFPPM